MSSPITYEQRLADIHVESDIDVQMERCGKLVATNKAKAKRTSLLSTKLHYQNIARHHEDVLRKLRIERYNIEDKLRKQG